MESNGVAQLPGNELGSVAKFDTTAIESALARTTDPKVYAALRQQLEILRRSAASRGMTHLRGAVQGRGMDQGAANAGQIRTAAVLGQRQQHQVLQQQQQQGGQQPGLIRQHKAVSEQVQNAGQTLPAGLAYRGQVSPESVNLLNPHASRSMASLPQHIQHQIQAQIQAQHIQAQLQNQAQFSKQRAAQANASSVPGNSGNSSAVFSAGLAPADDRIRKSSPKAAVVGAGPVQANGTMAAPSASNVHPGAQLLTSSLPSTAAGVAQSQGLLGPGRRRTAAQPVQPQGPEVSQMTQQQIAALQAMTVRKKEESEKLEAERKRFAQEAELREMAEHKKRRLANAPGNDLSFVLSADYSTPFGCVSDAWQRLVPYHILLPKKSSENAEEKWNAEVESLCEKYRTWLRALKGKFNGLCELDHENVSAQSADYGTGALNNDDCIVMEQVLLEDVYETARKKKALADKRAHEIARRQAMEAEARKLAEQKAVALAAARHSAMQASQTNPASAPERRPEYSTNMYGVSSTNSSITVPQGGRLLGSQPPVMLPKMLAQTTTPATVSNIQSQLREQTGSVHSKGSGNLYQGARLVQDRSSSHLPASSAHAGVHRMSVSGLPGLQYPAAPQSNQTGRPHCVNQGSSPPREPLTRRELSQEERQPRRSPSGTSPAQEKQSLLAASRPISAQEVNIRAVSNPGVLNQAWGAAQRGLSDFSAEVSSRQLSPPSIPVVPVLGANGPLKEAIHKTLSGSLTVDKLAVSDAADMVRNVGSYRNEQVAGESGGSGHRQSVMGYQQSVISQAGTPSVKAASRLSSAQLPSNASSSRGLELGTKQLNPVRGIETAQPRLPSLANVQQSNQIQLQPQLNPNIQAPQASVPVSVLKPQLDGQQERFGEIRTLDPPSSLGVSLPLQKNQADNGILSSHGGLSSWASMGLPSGHSQQQPSVSRVPETVPDNGNKERRGMGMGSLLNSEGN